MKYDFEELMKENMNIQESPSKELNAGILHNDEEEQAMHDKKKYRKYLVKAAAGLLGSGAAYASSGLWNHFVAKDFGVEQDHETMRDMKEKGYVQQPQAQEMKGTPLSVTDQDITVTVLQTLADESSVHVCYEVKYGEQYPGVWEGSTENSDYGIPRPQWTSFTLASGREMNYCGGVSKIVDAHTVLYEDSLSLVDMGEHFENEKITMSISAFEMDQEKCDANPELLAKDGKWEMSWDLSVGTEKRVYHLDRTLTLGKYHFVVKDLELTPLSYNLVIECPDQVSLDEVGAVVPEDYWGEQGLEDILDQNGDMEVIRYIRTGGEENVDRILEKLRAKGQTMLGLDTVFVRMKEKDFDGMGGMGSIENKDGNTILYEQFDKVLNFEEMTGIRVAGKYVDLTGAEYEIVKSSKR